MLSPQSPSASSYVGYRAWLRAYGSHFSVLLLCTLASHLPERVAATCSRGSTGVGTKPCVGSYYLSTGGGAEVSIASELLLSLSAPPTSPPSSSAASLLGSPPEIQDFSQIIISLLWWLSCNKLSSLSFICTSNFDSHPYAIAESLFSSICCRRLG